MNLFIFFYFEPHLYPIHSDIDNCANIYYIGFVFIVKRSFFFAGFSIIAGFYALFCPNIVLLLP